MEKVKVYIAGYRKRGDSSRFLADYKYRTQAEAEAHINSFAAHVEAKLIVKEMKPSNITWATNN